MRDLTDRLRTDLPHYGIMREAAEEIERLRAEVERLKSCMELVSAAVWASGNNKISVSQSIIDAYRASRAAQEAARHE